MSNLPQSFLAILDRAASRFSEHASKLSKTDEYKLDNAVGKIIRQAVETSHQDAAVLKDFVNRYNSEGR